MCCAKTLHSYTLKKKSNLHRLVLEHRMSWKFLLIYFKTRHFLKVMQQVVSCFCTYTKISRVSPVKNQSLAVGSPRLCAGYQETEDQRVIMHENNEVCEELIRDSWKMYKNAMSVTNFS